MSTFIIAVILVISFCALWSRALRTMDPDVKVRVVRTERGDWAIELPDGFQIGPYVTAADAAYFAGLNGWGVED